MTDGEKLRDLVHELERTHSPLQRLRLIALAWRTVRGLSRQEREDLALKVGLAEAGELVERLAARDHGLAPTELLEAIHGAETADPARLRRLVAGVKEAVADPGERQRLLDRAVEALDHAATRVPPPSGPLGVVAAAERAAAARPAPPLPPAARPAPPPSPTPSEAPAPTAPAAPPSMPIAPRPAQAPEHPPATPPPPRTERREPPPPAAEVHAAPVAPDRHGLVGRLNALHRGEHERAEPGKLLAAFPPGWPRRRALCALLEQGVPGTFEAALDLVAGLDAERDRAWCLATLIRSRRPSEAQLQAALQLVNAPAQRKRLLRLATAPAEA